MQGGGKEAKRGDQREKMPKGTAATARAKGGVEGWRQRPKGGGGAERQRREAAREGRAKRGERREGGQSEKRRGARRAAPHGRDNPNGAEKTEAIYIGALPTAHRRKLPMSNRCWAVERHKNRRHNKRESTWASTPREEIAQTARYGHVEPLLGGRHKNQKTET
jgi:hypothetical protein